MSSSVECEDGDDGGVGEECGSVVPSAKPRRRRSVRQRPLESLARAIVGGQKVLFITGAGISIDSGVRPFRGPDGLWNDVIYTAATREAFQRDPLRFYNDFWLPHFGASDLSRNANIANNGNNAKNAKNANTDSVNDRHHDHHDHDHDHNNGTSNTRRNTGGRPLTSNGSEGTPESTTVRSTPNKNNDNRNHNSSRSYQPKRKDTIPTTNEDKNDDISIKTKKKRSIHPNPAHYALDFLLRTFSSNVKLITQNIDGLHHAAALRNGNSKHRNQSNHNHRSDDNNHSNGGNGSESNRNPSSFSFTSTPTNSLQITSMQNIIEAHGRMGWYKCVPEEDSDSDSEDDDDHDRPVHLGHRRKHKILQRQGTYLPPQEEEKKRKDQKYNESKSGRDEDNEKGEDNDENNHEHNHHDLDHDHSEEDGHDNDRDDVCCKHNQQPRHHNVHLQQTNLNAENGNSILPTSPHRAAHHRDATESSKRGQSNDEETPAASCHKKKRHKICPYQYYESIPLEKLEPIGVRQILMEYDHLCDGDETTTNNINGNATTATTNYSCRGNSKSGNSSTSTIKQPLAQTKLQKKSLLSSLPSKALAGGPHAPLIGRNALPSAPLCPHCQRPCPPQALLFDEGYHSHSHYQFIRMEEWITQADILVFCGTSFAVHLTNVALGHARAFNLPVYNFNIRSKDVFQNNNANNLQGQHYQNNKNSNNSNNIKNSSNTNKNGKKNKNQQNQSKKAKRCWRTHYNETTTTQLESNARLDITNVMGSASMTLPQLVQHVTNLL